MEQAVIPRPGGVAAGGFAPSHIGELTRIVPFEMVDAVLAETGAVQRRVRLVPARVTVYLPQDTLAHQLAYPYRADSESVHSQFDLSLWNRRMIAYGVERQKAFVLGYALSQNATSHQLHLSKAP
ncbi:transposase domain-containing protein [Streptomyces sp. NPDC006430]|uniref:transposase domain-containing protein n=1 Tax=Streptomyces sp. NPDC006430 TaxID=3154299 RepID=UPI0033A3CB38